MIKWWTFVFPSRHTNIDNRLIFLLCLFNSELGQINISPRKDKSCSYGDRPKGQHVPSMQKNWSMRIRYFIWLIDILCFFENKWQNTTRKSSQWDNTKWQRKKDRIYNWLNSSIGNNNLTEEMKKIAKVTSKIPYKIYTYALRKKNKEVNIEVKVHHSNRF